MFHVKHSAMTQLISPRFASRPAILAGGRDQHLLIGGPYGVYLSKALVVLVAPALRSRGRV